MVTTEAKVYMMRPKEESNIIIKDLISKVKNTSLIGAKIHNNSLVLLTHKKAVFLVPNVEEFEVEEFCASYNSMGYADKQLWNLWRSRWSGRLWCWTRA